jgi:hypothetical protein
MVMKKRKRRKNPALTSECDFCHKVVKHWVDGATTLGPWANMCKGCFGRYGIGLGTGRGQEYVEGKKIRG